MVCEHPLTQQFADEVGMSAAVLEEMEEGGPSAAVWWSLPGLAVTSFRSPEPSWPCVMSSFLSSRIL
ncbi:hypothetical protein Stube_67270 [Streptomyces tubercidicus]|uniref:Uncharacterized protein n=1 Tax=Streptomyces tubercidicus TaxID=47759 RepID=A0A640V382_9ACTN|nr:hypothetical protein Stube_67270 [Streptomyces tubercidicus]